MNSRQIILGIFAFLMWTTSSAQLGYKKDSLQIKVYTEITYRDYKPVHIEVKKVFCDYCSENQIKLIGEEALRRTKDDQYNPKYVSANDKTRLALFIRVAKRDFAKLKDGKQANKNNN